MEEKEPLKFPTKKRGPVSMNPKILLLYGAPKCGKTTMLSKLDNCLILDTEQGANMISGYIMNIKSIGDIHDVIIEGYKYPGRFKYVAIDTIDRYCEFVEQDIVDEYNAKHPNDPVRFFGETGNFGSSYGEQRVRVINMLKELSRVFEHVILIGHRKLASSDDKGIVQPESLDLTGKLKNMLMAASDANGYVFRDEEGNLKITFKNRKNKLESGARCPHLKNKVIDFDWKLIYKEEGEKNGD